MDMATTTNKEQAMNITHRNTTYTIIPTGIENDICTFYEITGPRTANGTLLIYKPDTFGTCARCFGISALERLSDGELTIIVGEQTNLIHLDPVAA
jgi:hypothetical protein